MKNITGDVWNVITKFLGGNRTEGDAIHGVSGTLNTVEELLYASDFDDEEVNGIFECMPEEDKEAFLDALKECISLASEHGLIEVAEIDDEGDFVYALTDKGQRLDELFTPPEGKTGPMIPILISLEEGDDWMIEILKDMGVFEQP